MMRGGCAAAQLILTGPTDVLLVPMTGWARGTPDNVQAVEPLLVNPMRKFDWVAMPSRPNTVAVRWLRAVHGSVPEVDALEVDSRLMNHVLDRARRKATITSRIVVVEILTRISSRGVSIRAITIPYSTDIWPDRGRGQSQSFGAPFRDQRCWRKSS